MTVGLAYLHVLPFAPSIGISSVLSVDLIRCCSRVVGIVSLVAMSAHDVPIPRDNGAGAFIPAQPCREPELLPCSTQRSIPSSSPRHRPVDKRRSSTSRYGENHRHRGSAKHSDSGTARRSDSVQARRSLDHAYPSRPMVQT